MLRLLKKLRQDENGVVLSTELAVVGTTMVVGLVTGMTCLQTSVNDELNDLSSAFRKLDQSYSVPSIRSVTRSGCHQLAFTAGSTFIDRQAIVGDGAANDAAENEPGQPVPSLSQEGPTPDAPPSINLQPTPQGVPLNGEFHHGHRGHGHVEHGHVEHGNRIHVPGAPLNGPRPGRHHGFVPDHIGPGGGAPLNEYSTGYGAGGYGYGGGYSAGFYRRGISSPAVEINTGVGHVRVSEWPSPTTGLTLTEEQHLSIGRQGPGSASCEPFCKKPYINIPDHVW